MKPTINIQKEVNPHFREVWTTKKPYNILRGGRNSFKSSVIVLLLVYMMIQMIMKGEKANVVVIRKVGNTIRDSVFLKIQWALMKYSKEFYDEFTTTVAPFKIVHRATGSSFTFYGSDDFEKLKSNDIGNIIAVWYEEASEFKKAEEFDQTNTTFMRQKHPNVDMVKFFWSYNPPRNPYHWINDWSDEMEGSPNHLVHRSSYLNDELGFVTDQMKQEIERIKENDYDYYLYLYEGVPVGLGTNVYNYDLFKIVDEIPEDERVLMIDVATDSGHQNSATVHGAFALCKGGNVYLVDTYYYSPANKANKKAPSKLSTEYKEWLDKVKAEWKKPIDMMTLDSAEGALRNQIYTDHGLRLHPIAKKKNVDMVDNVHILLAQGRLHILRKPCNEIVLEQHKRYTWDERTLHTDDPKVIKEFDDCVDMLKYYVNDNLRKLGLKQ